MNWRGSLRNPDAPALARWDWGWLEACFAGTRISPSDVDAFYVLERSGACLFLECKKPGDALPAGQAWAFAALSRHHLEGTATYATVLVLWGRRDRPEEWQVFSRGVAGPRECCEREAVVEYVLRWMERAGTLSSEESKP